MRISFLIFVALILISVHSSNESFSDAINYFSDKFQKGVHKVWDPIKNKINKWTSVFREVDKNVNVLFSPNLFEAYSYTLDNMTEIFKSQKFQKNIPTVIYIHGWLSNGELEESVAAIRSAYRGRNDHNFIAVDWSTYSHWHFPVPYYSAMTKLKEICLILADRLDKVRRGGYENFYIVGHSLGGQCAGLVGRTLKKLSKGEFMLSKIYALDPAGPGYEFHMEFHIKGFDCLSKNDAKYVQVIHTSGGKCGIENSVGHTDFYPNGGQHQPGCSNRICNHCSAWIFFQHSVRIQSVLLGLQCDSYKHFVDGKCENNTIYPMGYYRQANPPNGTFYLRTHPSRYGPGLGEDGIGTKKFKMIHQDGKIVYRPDAGVLNVLDSLKNIETTDFDFGNFEQRYNNIQRIQALPNNLMIVDDNTEYY